ncbi:MAG: ATP-binding cassette domain-containing protein [Candidatus Marinimicrobia bacterium]|nr:ATP-binding cassette domain-containing protein [Candidatus Neomarinimicrobiota bacterium]
MLLNIRDLKTYFPGRKQYLFSKPEQVKAIDGVTISIEEGETLGLVGESGSGKSTLGKAIVNLVTKTGGTVMFKDFADEKHQSNSGKIQMVFQDPLASLNPRMTVGNAISEVLKYHRIVPKDKILQRVKALFRMVELSPDLIFNYPHQFSGGQRQRIGIARALAVNPELIICDEVVSALDVSIQAQIINLLKRLQIDQGIAYLFISHDLAVVRQIAHRIAVLYCGRIVEIGRTDEIISSPMHPYTQALFSVASESNSGSVSMISTEVANPANPPDGCHFHPRCPIANNSGNFIGACSSVDPDLKKKSGGRMVACHQI